MKYRNNAKETVEAIQFLNTRGKINEICEFVGESYVLDTTNSDVLKLYVPDKVLTVHERDYIVKSKYCLFVCKPHIFHSIYRPERQVE